MQQPTHVWRPKPHVRAIAIGLVRRADAILVMAVYEDDGSLKGWRPVGGGIEFGEPAASALEREIAEELGCAATVGAQLAVIENIYSHQGTTGHEIVFVFEAALADPAAYERASFTFEDAGITNRVEWVCLDAFARGEEALLPPGLLPWLTPA